VGLFIVVLGVTMTVVWCVCTTATAPLQEDANLFRDVKPTMIAVEDAWSSHLYRRLDRIPVSQYMCVVRRDVVEQLEGLY
jgi:hypothetical protein